jgi:hypothetical protein
LEVFSQKAPQTSAGNRYDNCSLFGFDRWCDRCGGIPAILDNIKSIPGFFEFFGIAQPQLADGRPAA